MHRPWTGFLRCLPALAVLAGITAWDPAPAEAGDITVFVSKARPDESWADGYGAALGSSFFWLVTLEAEVARLPAELADSGMTSFTGSALLTAPIPIVKPYGGLGVGLFRQTRAGFDDDHGTLRAVVLGAKATFGLAVVRADYRRLYLSGPPLIDIERRFSLGVGLSF